MILAISLCLAALAGTLLLTKFNPLRLVRFPGASVALAASAAQ